MRRRSCRGKSKFLCRTALGFLRSKLPQSPSCRACRLELVARQLYRASASTEGQIVSATLPAPELVDSTKDALDTPALCLDLAAMDANIRAIVETPAARTT